MKFTNLVRLLTSIIICELAGVVGSIVMQKEIGGWYDKLHKPGFNPPGWVFGPVWAVLFVLMGVSLYLVWSKKWEIKDNTIFKKNRAWNSLSQKFYSGVWEKANIILIFDLQLALNIIWSIIFFGFHSPAVAFFEMLMLWFSIIFTIINFARISKAAAYLLLPYMIWVSFAIILNYLIWILN